MTQLGYVDWNSSSTGFGDGLAGTPQVGLWKGTHGDASPVLLTNVTLFTGTAATLVGSYRYVTLTTPITLLTNTTYQIMGYGYNTDNGLDWFGGSSTVNPTLGLSGFRAEAHLGELGFGNLNGNASWNSSNTCGTANFIGTLTDPNAARHITASVSGSGGTINPSGDVLVDNGGNQTFTITANAHYAINQVLVDDVNNPGAVTAGSYTFSGVTGNHTIADVLVDSASVGAVSNYTFSANSADHTITASFAIPPPQPQPMLISRGTGGWRTDTFTIGTTFTTGSNSVYVAKLGYVDRGTNGLAASHEVGIWQSGTLVVSASQGNPDNDLLERV